MHGHTTNTIQEHTFVLYVFIDSYCNKLMSLEGTSPLYLSLPPSLPPSLPQSEEGGSLSMASFDVAGSYSGWQRAEMLLSSLPLLRVLFCCVFSGYKKVRAFVLHCMFVCACVCVCVRACVRVCVRAWRACVRACVCFCSCLHNPELLLVT